MISKALLNSNAEAIDLCEHLNSWDIPARLTVNASGNASRYVILDSANLTLNLREKSLNILWVVLMVPVLKFWSINV